ncbi:MAG: DUF1553 domain-containing protein [Chthoniobacteraceae bacterium]
MFRSLALIYLLALPILAARAEDARALWVNGAQPVLDLHCVKCHGPLEQKSELELDTAEAVLKGNEYGPVVTPENLDESPLLEVLTAKSDPHMPPKKQLTEEEIQKITSWVKALAANDGGAKPKVVPTPPDGAEPAAAIDHYLALGWSDRGVTPSEPASDLVFVRRIYLDLAGRIPSPSEVAEFCGAEAPSKREALIDRLLASDEYPRHFREVWDALLMGRADGRRAKRRAESGWFGFLETAFAKNRPWNEVVRAMIVARPDKPEDEGAPYFLFERRDEHQLMAEAVAPLIYGTRLDCAQCHDHPLAREIKQGHYWGLVAAFNRSKNVKGRDGQLDESAIGGFINFTNLKKESQPAVMMMLAGPTIEENRPEGDAKQEDAPELYIDPDAKVRVPKFSRRGALAEAATSTANPGLARSFVNHTWAILMGRGIVNPVDEMNSKCPPSHPELLDWLAADFATHGYDMRRLIRGIVLSRGYQLAAPATNAQLPPEAFAAALERPLVAESVARSAAIASGRTAIDDELRGAFVEKFPDVLPRAVSATIQQAMFTANDERLAGIFGPGGDDTAASQLATLPALEDRVRGAFLRALIREPDSEEMARGLEFLQARIDQPAAATGNLLWALVTGPEFATNH